MTRADDWAVQTAVARADCLAANSVVVRAVWWDYRRVGRRAVSRALNSAGQLVDSWAAKMAESKALTRVDCSGYLMAVLTVHSRAAWMVGRTVVQSARMLVDLRVEQKAVQRAELLECLWVERWVGATVDPRAAL